MLLFISFTPFSFPLTLFPPQLVFHTLSCLFLPCWLLLGPQELPSMLECWRGHFLQILCRYPQLLCAHAVSWGQHFTALLYVLKWHCDKCQETQPGMLATVASLISVQSRPFKPPATPVTTSWVSQCKLQSKTWAKTHQVQWHFKWIYAFWLIGLLSYANVFMSLCLYSSADNAIELSTLRLKNKETKVFYESLFHKNPDYTFLHIYKHFVSGASLLRLRRRFWLDTTA